MEHIQKVVSDAEERMGIRTPRKRDKYCSIPWMIVDAGLSPSALALYVHLEKACKGLNGICFASLKTMSERTGMNKETIIKYRRELEERGFIHMTIEDIPGHNKKTIVNLQDVWAENDDRYKLTRPVGNSDSLVKNEQNLSESSQKPVGIFVEPVGNTVTNQTLNQTINQSEQEAEFDKIVKTMQDPTEEEQYKRNAEALDRVRATLHEKGILRARPRI